MTAFTESVVEDAALAWLEALGYAVLHGPDIAAGEPGAERSDPNYRDVVLERRLRQALVRLNPDLPPEALEDAYRKLTRVDAPSLVERNRAVHRMLVDGVTVEYRRKDGSIAGAQARVIDFDDARQQRLAGRQPVHGVEGQHTRRPDVVLFVNGLPLAVIELKNPADENATIWSAFQQLQTYQAQIPALFATNAALVVSDGVQARIGSLGAGKEWFKPWRTITGREDAPPKHVRAAGGAGGRVRASGASSTCALLHRVRGSAARRRQARQEDGRLPPVPRGERGGGGDAARGAVAGRGPVAEPPGRYEAGQRPGGEPGDRRVGVVWHTQGSGKSLTMAFYAGRVILHPAMANPTIVVLTDRNDLDDQLFGTFARCRDLLRQPPVQAADRADLRAKLAVASGGVVFTTIQKFFPEEKGDRHPVLSERRNIVVIADEAHRSQYDFIDGFARHMRDALPNASFVGFTGTPIEKTDANTRAVFGDYISVYDIQRAVVDGATVPIYYESRLAKLELKESERPKIDPEFEEATEGEEVERKEKLKSKWAQLEAVVGSENRIKLIARDLVEHFENRLATMDGKAMVVVHEPPHLRRAVPRARRAAPGVARRGRRAGRAQGRDDRLGVGPARLAAAHPQQAAARGAGAALPRPDGPVPDRDRARHVAHRLRRAEPAHDVRGQADARARADAGHRPREPRVQGQARRAGRGLPRPRRRAEAGAGDLHGGGRHRARPRSIRPRPWR